MDDTVDIRPQKGDTSVPIPFTLEVPRQSGYKRYKNHIYFAIGISVIFFVIDLGILFAGPGGFFSRLLFLPILIYAQILFVRYPVLEEAQYRKDIQRQLLNDYKMGTDSIWGIYSVESEYPHIAYFRNKRVGMFVLFEKNVRIGRDTADHHYKHYEAIADAYKYAGQMGLSIMHIDYMGLIGTDPRMDNLFASLSSVQNTDVRDTLTEIYSELANELKYSTSAQDVFVLSSTGTPEDLLEGFSAFKDNMLQANYVSFRILNQRGIQEVTKELYGLREFSASQASLESISESYKASLRPMKLIKEDGSEVNLRPPTPAPTPAGKKAPRGKRKKPSGRRKK